MKSSNNQTAVSNSTIASRDRIGRHRNGSDYSGLWAKMKVLMLFALALAISALAYGGQEDGVPDLIRELSCADAEHRELAGVVLRQLYSDRYPQDPSTPTNSAGWSQWWEQTGKTNKVQTLWHNFDSHYK